MNAHGGDEGTNRDYEEFISYLIERLLRYIIRHDVNCIAFLSPDQGPIGVVQFRALLCLYLEKTAIRTVIARINERLLRNQIVCMKQNDPWSPPLDGNDNVLIFSDAITSGTSIIKAVNIIRTFGAKCNVAFTVYDREDPEAKQSLGEKSIYYETLSDKKFLAGMGSLPVDAG